MRLVLQNQSKSVAFTSAMGEKWEAWVAFRAHRRETFPKKGMLTQALGYGFARLIATPHD